MRRIITVIICCLVACTYSLAQTKKASVQKRSTDLSFFELKGPVRAMNNGAKFLFSPQGRLISINGKNPVAKTTRMIMDPDDFFYLRDAKGNIEAVYGWEYTATYKWRDGYVISREEDAEGDHTFTTYTYDKDGNITVLTKKTWEEGDKDNVKTFTEEYTYSEFDSHGNWTVCTINGEEIKRTITYYTGK